MGCCAFFSPKINISICLALARKKGGYFFPASPSMEEERSLLPWSNNLLEHLLVGSWRAVSTFLGCLAPPPCPSCQITSNRRSQRSDFFRFENICSRDRAVGSAFRCLWIIFDRNFIIHNPY